MAYILWIIGLIFYAKGAGNERPLGLGIAGVGHFSIQEENRLYHKC